MWCLAWSINLLKASLMLCEILERQSPDSLEGSFSIRGRTSLSASQASSIGGIRVGGHTASLRQTAISKSSLIGHFANCAKYPI
uniref:Secreted protein n=1 Tax=Triticum urartu TaxID=4572 RepID=A0A8R7TBY0_TRIUA